ncbi:hypothetical protein MPTK1_7g05200 [Marchantia polymorpha subsp. ruderalis]|uniref:Lipid-binding serum glycoprotein N-terminal domain-containing protein n=2 Tax=Marchantia polymorpha TaxID=3197 RepID=A0A176WK58_MARPO|nr:hypothetical protein AXG93_2374s1220 [Marchantia polymorpha subsp. ruderalis]PTQ36576.1 hypothetical protein MARPO_0062s0005 [Marchantia polymorpha]PTQ36577.1 hypothetical protein MARPO_0062s0005 [Marchantia polymorpha]BBN16304.1 hypothetical protein Mp_7g05200 [Marchantia polymorpha subsp. ruderalis]BBN16305.1 hypothetical protein Mp_7g05200 [Marchantia polymorpha subsp. ruderalis]|eukprot:PTQ36576.1 hypothetical protein MARPO_0062s0005 [Marchantia polymorpha]
MAGHWALIVAMVVGVLAAAAGVDATVTEILKNYGLPAGLLPSTVKSYTLADNGKFEVKLDAPCYAKIEDDVYYSNSITGTLSFGKIQGLDGIQAREGWFWLCVTGIVARSDSIEFQVGPFSKSLDIDLFTVSPNCKSGSNGKTFSEWLSQALNGDLKVNVASILEENLPRKMLQ